MTHQPDALTAFKNDLQGLLDGLLLQTGVPQAAAHMRINEHTMEFFAVHESSLSLDAGRLERFESGSLVKLLAAIVAWRSMEEGRLCMDAPLGEYIRELQDSEIGTAVHVQHLLSHTSGYQDLSLWHRDVRLKCQWSTLLEHLRDAPLLFKPGSTFSYSDTGYVLLAEILERALGESMEVLIRKFVMEGFGLSHDTNVTPFPHHVLDLAARQFVVSGPMPRNEFWNRSVSPVSLSMRELLDVGVSLKAGERGSPAGRNRSLLARMVENRIPVPRTTGNFSNGRSPVACGQGCLIYDNGLIGADGPMYGQLCSLRIDPQFDLAMAVGFTAHVPGMRDLIVDSLVGSLKPSSEAAPQSHFCELTSGDLAGRYVGPVGFEPVVSVSGKDLLVELVNTFTRDRTIVMISRDESGEWVVQGDSGPLLLGFFQDPASGTPCLLINLGAYRKV